MTFSKSMLNDLLLPKDSLFKQVFLHSPVAIVITDEYGAVVSSNEAFSSLCGYTADEIRGAKLSLLKSGRHDHAFYEKMWKKLNSDGIYEGEIWNRHKDQSMILLEEKIQRIYYKKKTYYIGTFEEITKKHQLMERYQYLALHDPLTGVANRHLAQDRFNHARANAIRSGKKVGLILCDLNEFKQVNDDFDHLTGDKILIETAQYLRQHLRESDTIARYGGDEFLIIVEDVKSSEELALLRDKCSAQIEVRTPNEDELVKISCSAGCSCFPEDGTTYEQLFRVADTKLYEQKNTYYYVELRL